jgi:hypothetical protein
VPAPPPTELASGLAGSPTPDPLLDRHADPDLETKLPHSVLGTPLQTRSLTAAEFVTPAAAAGFGQFVQQLGGNLDDVTLASGFDPDGLLSGAISALRVPGADPAALLAAYIGLETTQASPAPTVAQREIGGRVVQAMSVGTGSTGLTRYVFAEGDVLFIVDAVEEQTATAFIEAVP